MTNDVSDGFKTVADFWTVQSKAMVEGMQAMFGGGMTLPVATIAAPPDVTQAGEAMRQLWSLATQLSTQVAGQLGQSAAGSPAAATMLERMTDPRQWMLSNGVIDEALARMVDGPRLADLWDVERRYGSVMRRWTELRQRSFEHQHVVLNAWMEAAQQFSAEMAGRAEGQALEPKEALARWTDIGNRHMLETQRSEPFLKSQREMIRASTEVRIAQSELSEFIGKQYGLPTRTELDDVHRSLTEMRREMRKMRRELDAAQLTAKPRASVARPVPSRRETR